jgi:hypothetical protein
MDSEEKNYIIYLDFEFILIFFKGQQVQQKLLDEF